MHEVKGSSGGAVKAGWVVAGILGACGVLFGLLGWRSELPSAYGFSEVAYRTWALFVLEFVDGGISSPVGTVLNVARFVAPAATFFALFTILADLMLRTWTRWQAGWRSRHDVVVGDGVGVVRLAVNLRGFTDSGLATTSNQAAKPRKVTLVSSPAAENDDELRKHKVQVVTGASDAVRDAVVRNANRVFIDYTTDAESARVAVSLAARHPGLDVITIFNEAELAEHWANDKRLPGRVVSQIATVAVEATRQHPPMRDDKACPPPIVVGDGAMAAELVRRIMTGWQQVGDRKLVHCIGAELAWTADAAAGLEHLGEVRSHKVCRRAEAVAQLVGDVVAQWRVPEGREAQVAGPTIYVALSSDSRGGLVATRLTKALPKARVVAVMEGDPGAWSAPDGANDNLNIISSSNTMTSPEALLRTKSQLFREELAKEAACWADETLEIFRGLRLEETTDGPHHRSMNAVIDAIVANIADLLAAGGVRLNDPSPTSAAALLNPWQLEAMADNLCQTLELGRPNSTELHVGYWASDENRAALTRERWFWAVEVSARLPSLAARAGWSPTLSEGTEPSLLHQADIEQMAEWVHETYRVTHYATGGATGSTAAQLPWDQLPDFLKSSNLASATAASQRLAALRLSWRRSEKPAPCAFTEEQVALLAEAEHRRWSHFHRRNGRDDHVMLKPWDGQGSLTEVERSFDRDPVLAFARQLGSLGIEIYDPSSTAAPPPEQEHPAPENAALKTQPVPTEAPAGEHLRWYPVTRCGTVTARRLKEPHEWTTEAGDVMQGTPGDWLVNDAWTVIDEEFQVTYVHVDGDTFERTGVFFARPAVADEVVESLEGTVAASDGDMVVRQASRPWVVPIKHFRDTYAFESDGDASPIVATFAPEGPVFVSYRRDGGTDLADEITALLRAGGIVPWRDMADLTPGLTEDEVGLVMRTGLSAMVLAASPGIEHSDFVPKVEMPPVLRRIELDGTARTDPFTGARLEFVVANATPLQSSADSDDQPPDGTPDYECLDGQFHTKMGDEFRDTCFANFKHYSFLEPQSPMLNSRGDLLRDLLRARIAVRKPLSSKGHPDLVVATQTRPEPSTFNRQDADLTMRLTGKPYDRIPASKSYAALQQALPVLVDVLFDAMASDDNDWKRLRFVGGGHLSLYWALGAALPTSRKGLTIGVDVPDPHSGKSLYWEDEEDGEATRYPIEPLPVGKPSTHEGQGRPGVAIHIGTTPRPRLALFERMVPNVPNCVSARALQVEYPEVPSSETEPRFSTKLNPASGSAIADDIAHRIKDIVRSEEDRLPDSPDVMLHINFAGPTSLALFIARRLSTYQVVFYEQDRFDFEEAQELLPVFVVEPGTYGGPITHVFSDEDRAAFRRGEGFNTSPRDHTLNQG